tara:strand:+ start:1493 stop:2611 length:1119 start_codon:yes stop_codon:yes gene_type:complete
MITVYLLDTSEQKFKYTTKKYNNYGDFVNHVIKQIKWYVFSIDNIIITLNEKIIKLNEVNLNNELDSNTLTKIEVYERKRDEYGNVCDSEFVTNFLKWRQICQDTLFAKDLEKSVNRSNTSINMNNSSVINYLSRFNRTHPIMPPLYPPAQAPPPPSPQTPPSPQAPQAPQAPPMHPITPSWVSVPVDMSELELDNPLPYPQEPMPASITGALAVAGEVAGETLPGSSDIFQQLFVTPPHSSSDAVQLGQPLPLNQLSMSQVILNTFIENIENLALDFNDNELEEMTDIKMVLTEEELQKCRTCCFKDIKDDSNYKVVEKCNFTLEEFTDESEILCLPCNHYFMLEEITEWLTVHSYKCPVCRMESGKGTML